MTRTVRDAAILLAALAAPDPSDPASRQPGRPAGADFTRVLDAGGLRGARIGVPRPVYFGYSPDTDALAEQALAVLKDAGAILIDPAPIETAARLDGPEDLVLLYEFKADLDAYLRTLTGAGPRSLAELIAFNDKQAAVEMPFFGQDRFSSKHRARARSPTRPTARRWHCVAGSPVRKASTRPWSVTASMRWWPRPRGQRGSSTW